MFGFLKKILGLPTKEEVEAAKAVNEAPYKVETPMINNKTGEIVEPVVIPAEVKVSAVNDQITDSVTQAVEPPKKTRKPRTPKAEKPVKEKAPKEKAAKARKPAAIKTTKRSKKA